MKSIRQTASLEMCKIFSGQISNRVGFFSFTLQETGTAQSNFSISKPEETGRKDITFLLKACASGQEMYRTTELKSVPETDVHLTFLSPSYTTLQKFFLKSVPYFSISIFYWPCFLFPSTRFPVCAGTRMMCLSEYWCPLLFYIRGLNCLSEATQRELLEELEIKLEFYASAIGPCGL